MTPSVNALMVLSRPWEIAIENESLQTSFPLA